MTTVINPSENPTTRTDISEPQPTNEKADPKEERVVGMVIETPGMSYDVARSVYAEVIQELAMSTEANREVTEEELAEMVEHKVGFYQVQTLMNALDVMDERGLGDQAVIKIKEVGGKTIMNAMAGDEEAKAEVSKVFSPDEGMEDFALSINNSQASYLSGYQDRLDAYLENERPKELESIIAHLNIFIGNLRKRAKLAQEVFGVTMEQLITYLRGIAQKVALHKGVGSLSPEELAFLTQATTI